ncbi:hypothetical protein A9Q02_17635 [Candidatus Chloroploca asiatica]|uniref:Uncharacterized protein n=1 Tax=Candidatus Chloroploca asiatica TaxID=1506545 RepID=A0A2H3L3P9_9CHLR|nr:hypothetical protein A9Q02_17635 [Candidatus Chloroploca asiatica]
MLCPRLAPRIPERRIMGLDRPIVRLILIAPDTAVNEILEIIDRPTFAGWLMMIYRQFAC